MKTALYKTAIFVTEVYKLYVCLSLSSVSYTHNMYKYLPFIISETNVSIYFQYSMYQYHSKFTVRQVNYSFVFAVKLTYGGREGDILFSFCF